MNATTTKTSAVHTMTADSESKARCPAPRVIPWRPFRHARVTLDVALSLGTALLGSGLVLTAAAAPVVESPAEFHGSGDFDGDGRTDLAIVDKTTGVFRIGYQTSPGNYAWSEARASGIAGVTAISIGRVRATTRDTLAVTSPEANRVNLLDVASVSGAAVPVAWHPPSVGPRCVVALDIGGAGNTAHEDLFAITAWNGPVGPIHQALARSTASSITPLGDSIAATDFQRGDRVQLKTGGAQMLGLVAANGGGQFQVFSLSTGTPVLVASASGLPDHARFVFHRFGPSQLHQFLFFEPGGSSLQLRAVQEPVPGTFSFAPAVTFTLPNSLTAVQVIPGLLSARLAVLHGSGSEVAVYDFDGASPPVLVKSFAAAADSEFTGVAALGDLNLLLYSGEIGTGHSSAFETRKWDGANYVTGPSGVLPDGSPFAAPANVFLFQAEPFVNPSPVMIQRLAAGDWSSQPSLAGVPLKINVVVETFGGTTAGLGSASAISLGDVTPPAAFGLANQYLPAISLFSFLPPVGDEVVDVQIAPSPGPQATAIQVSLAASVPGATLRYRFNDAGAWTAYSAPFTLFRDTTVRYYAQIPASDRKSVVHSATYTFADDPASMDSDGDGVPDFAELGLDADNNGIPDYAELGLGLDPVVAGKDSDGDGFGDLDEWVAGTQPYSDASTPAIGSRLEDRSGFDLYITPRPLDGTVPALSTASTGSNLRLHALSGTLLQFSTLALLPLPAPPGVPTARMTNIAADIRQRLLAVASEPHFAMATASADSLLGREMVGLLPVPNLVAGIPVAYSPGAGTPQAEAAAWRAAAQAAATAQPRVEWVRDLEPADTLTAALCERKIELLLQARGLAVSNQVSLFSFRTTDAGRYIPSQDELLALEQEADGHAAFRLSDLHGAISNAVVSPPSANAQRLRDLGNDVYRISSVYNNGSPASYPLPLDVLRDFLRTGVLHSNYLAQTSLDAVARAAAATGVGEVLDLPQPRPTATLELTAQPGGLTAECTTLYSGADPRSLVFADGSAFLFPESFDLVPGTTITVTGYIDLPSGSCPGEAIEVMAASVASVPGVPIMDSDGDLLPDSYECVFFGSVAAAPFDDLDGDLFSNLQEYLDGTDPGDNLAQGAAPVLLAPPVIHLSLKPNGSLGLQWNFPSVYADRVHFGVRTAPSLGSSFVELPALVVPAGADTFEVQLPPPAGNTQFYVLYLRLK